MAVITAQGNAPSAAPASASWPEVWPMLRTNLALGVTVFLCWLIFGGERGLNAVANHWQVSVTMVFGSLVGGGTSEGGGAVGFPVLTKVLAVPADQARLFTFAIQSVGMGCASISIISNRVPLEWRALRFGAPAAVVGVFLSCLFLAPMLQAPTVRLTFTAILVGMGLALWISLRFAPDRRDLIDLFGRGERVALVGAGFLGGLLSGLAAVGENTIMFALLVLGFRVCERIVTPTTVVLLTIVTWTGFLTHALVMGDFQGPPVDMWLAAVPVVAIGAPTGALICTRLSRTIIVRILYVLISIEFVSTLLLVPMGGGRGLIFAVAIPVFAVICARLAMWQRYLVSPHVAASTSCGDSHRLNWRALLRFPR
jgi:uncharacterized membrane protein YfcA